jgi:hypothetical protein
MEISMKSLTSKIAGFVAGLALASGLAYATNVFYAGYNAQTNQFGINGVVTAGGPIPTSGASTSCGTLGAIVGGTYAGQVTTAAVTTCTLQLVLPVPTLVVSGGANSAAAPNGLICRVFDITHPAVEAIASTTTTSCTTGSMTITAGDVLQYELIAY